MSLNCGSVGTFVGDVKSLQDKHGPERKLSEFEELTDSSSVLSEQSRNSLE